MKDVIVKKQLIIILLNKVFLLQFLRHQYFSWTLYVRVYAYFEMLGMQLKEGTDEDFVEAANISMGQAAYPASGYIVEKDNFIVVKLGDYIPLSSLI